MAARGDKQTFSGTGANSRAIRSGQIDFYFHNSGDPNGAGIQAALGRDLTFLKLTPKIRTILSDNGFSRVQSQEVFTKVATNQLNLWGCLALC